MTDRARRILNAVDRRLDLRAIHASSEVRYPVYDVVGPCTARVALEPALRAARRLDRAARLKTIVSPRGVFDDGTSDRWEFAFDLPARRATLTCDLQHVTADDPTDPAAGSTTLTVTVRPFPATGGVLRTMVEQGRLLHRQLDAHWRREMERTPDLPLAFRDTHVVMREVCHQGLDPAVTEFSLTTSFGHDGAPRWEARSRHDTCVVPFAS